MTINNFLSYIPKRVQLNPTLRCISGCFITSKKTACKQSQEVQKSSLNHSKEYIADDIATSDELPQVQGLPKVSQVKKRKSKSKQRRQAKQVGSPDTQNNWEEQLLAAISSKKIKIKIIII